MRFRLRSILLVAVLQIAVAANAQEPVSIGVMDFVGKGGIPPDKVEALEDLLAGEIARMGNVAVISEVDLLSMFKLEKRRRLIGCSSKECLTEIGGAFGVRWMVSGNVSVFGDLHLLNLKLFDTENVIVISRVSRRISGGEEMLLAELPGAVHDLFARVGERMGLSMAETVTVAARHPQPLKHSPAAVTVITREDIEASGAENIGDLLRMVPGMDVILAGEIFTSLSARLYWSNENHHFLLLIDGRDASDELIGCTFLHIQPIFLDDVERIEIIRGPGSSLYGANAQAGVISITTRTLSEEASGSARVVTGEPGMIAASARASARVSDWGFSLNGGAEIMGRYWAPAERGREILRTRGIVERRLGEERYLHLEGGFTTGSGVLTSTLGALNAEQQLGTLRLLYESEDVRAQLYWVLNRVESNVGSDLVFSGIRLAKLQPVVVDGHVVDGDVQWTIPAFYDLLMLIVGGRIRVSYLTSDSLLSSDYADITSPRYHKPGTTHWEERAGAFLHGELALADWVTVTGGVRLDYNTVTGEFLSPRLAAVFRPAAGQFFRAGVARAFRKPAFQETHAHLQAIFPEDSPITGPAQEKFQEFMSRAVGNSHLENEELLSFEVAYLGQFLDGRLSVALDLYYNYHTKVVDFISVLVPDEQGLPDLDISEFRFVNIDAKLDIIGGEMCIRFSPSRYVFLQASWAHRQVLEKDTSPKNLITLGGRFRTDFGLLGSLYVFSRSEFMDPGVENPDGMMAPELGSHHDNVMLVLAKLGWRWETRLGVDVETGFKLFLPFSPFSGPLFRYHERGGGVTPEGKRYGGTELSRALTAYLQGSF